MTTSSSETGWDTHIAHIKEELENLEADLAALREQLRRSRERVEGGGRDEFLRAYM